MKLKAALLLVLLFFLTMGAGIANSLLGSAWPAISTDLLVPMSRQSVIIVSFYIGNTIGATFAQNIVARFRSYLPTIAGIFLLLVTIFLFSKSNSFIQIALVAVFMGLGMGFIQTSVNAYVARHYDTSAMNWLHSFFGIGCMIAPVFLAYFIGTHGSWRLGYQASSAIELLILILLVISYPLWKIHGKVLPRRKNSIEEQSEKSGDIKAKSLFELAKIKGTKSIIATMFFFCSFEITIIYWCTSYLVAVKDFTDGAAASMMIFFFAGQIGGRIIAGFIVMKISDTKMTRICLFIVLVFIIALFVIPTSALAVVLTLLGIATGPLFPNLIHEVPSVVGIENAQGVIGFQFASAYASNIIVPLLFSAFASKFGFGVFPVFLLILLGASIAIKMYQDAGQAKLR